MFLKEKDRWLWPSGCHLSQTFASDFPDIFSNFFQNTCPFPRSLTTHSPVPSQPVLCHCFCHFLCTLKISLVFVLSAFLLAICKVLFTLLHISVSFYPRLFPSPLCPLFIVITKDPFFPTTKKEIPQPLCFRQIHWKVHRCRCTENNTNLDNEAI